MTQEVPSQKETKQEPSTVDKIQESAQDFAEQANEKMHHITESASQVMDQASDIQQMAKLRAEELNHTAITLIQDKPIIALGLAFGIGYILGSAAKRRWIV